jgi:hypothetical protein
MTTPKFELGDIESAIRGHYEKRDSGLEGFNAAIPVAPAVAAAPVADNSQPSFIHLDYTINEAGHRDFQLNSQGVAEDIQGIIAELQHTLGHLINDSQASAE